MKYRSGTILNLIGDATVVFTNLVFSFFMWQRWQHIKKASYCESISPLIHTVIDWWKNQLDYIKRKCFICHQIVYLAYRYRLPSILRLHFNERWRTWSCITLMDVYIGLVSLENSVILLDLPNNPHSLFQNY
jgi:hypothetical protein